MPSFQYEPWGDGAIRHFGVPSAFITAMPGFTMVGTSLAMAPAWILGQLCDINDLDGTLFITRDRTPAMAFENGKVSYPDSGWGAAA